jgi:hypothetical protein
MSSKVVQVNLSIQLSLLGLAISTTIVPLHEATTQMLGNGQGISIFCLPDCWLEVSVQTEGPDTGQFRQVFLAFSVFKQMPRWFKEFKLLLNASHAFLTI